MVTLETLQAQRQKLLVKKSQLKNLKEIEDNLKTELGKLSFQVRTATENRRTCGLEFEDINETAMSMATEYMTTQQPEESIQMTMPSVDAVPVTVQVLDYDDDIPF
jgi:hypothetical protein